MDAGAQPLDSGSGDVVHRRSDVWRSGREDPQPVRPDQRGRRAGEAGQGVYVYVYEYVRMHVCVCVCVCVYCLVTMDVC